MEDDDFDFDFEIEEVEDNESKDAEMWYLGYMTALTVLEKSVNDLKRNGKKEFDFNDIKDMLKISKAMLRKSYKIEFRERILN